MKASIHAVRMLIGCDSFIPSWRKNFFSSQSLGRSYHTSFKMTSSASSNKVESTIFSSSRGRNAVALLPTYLADARTVEKYHPIHSPHGTLQLSVAENQMLEDVLVPVISKFSSSTTTHHQEVLFQSNQIYYQPTHGRPSLREVMATYLENLLNLNNKGQKLDPDGLVLGAGCNAVLENLCFCLTEPGDAVLLPTPYYAAFEFDLVARAGLKIIPVNTISYHMSSSTESTRSTIPQSFYYPNKATLDAAFNQAKSLGHNPRILLLSHPNNPLGVCYPKSVLHECIDWCNDNQIHLISDEIYAGSIHDTCKQSDSSDDATFHSVLSLASSSKKDETKKLGLGPFIHFVYALSKDFALSGLRVGVAYSENEEIRVPMQKLNDLCQISSQTQVTVENMLSATTTDDTLSKSGSNMKEMGKEQLWSVHEFLPLNQERIRTRCTLLSKCLDEAGIPYLPATSGLFIWMDLSEFLPKASTNSDDKSSDIIKDQRERSLYLELMKDYGLLFTPGRSMRNELPGFFRCVFTAASDDEFNLGLDRIKAFVKAKRETNI